MHGYGSTKAPGGRTGCISVGDIIIAILAQLCGAFNATVLTLSSLRLGTLAHWSPVCRGVLPSTLYWCWLVWPLCHNHLTSRKLTVSMDTCTANLANNDHRHRSCMRELSLVASCQYSWGWKYMHAVPWSQGLKIVSLLSDFYTPRLLFTRLIHDYGTVYTVI